MSYTNYTTKKLWEDKVSVRDYIVDKAIAKKEGLKIKYKDALMTIEAEDVKDKIISSHTASFKSKYEDCEDKEYELSQFIWRADIEDPAPVFFGDEYDKRDY